MLANSKTLEKRISGFIREYGLISGGETVLVAVSGGPDSVCMLYVLHNLKEMLDIQLHIAHLDHGLRGDSGADAEYVKGLASAIGISATVERRDVAEWRSRRKISLEEAAREVRYRFLNDTARQAGSKRVAVGHTRDDQVETTLMHILRGSGIQGLRGLRPAAPMPYGAGEDGIWVIRPLLEVARRETEAYCAQNNLQPRKDTSNDQVRFLRNRIRLELIPLLRQYNSDIEGALLRLSDLSGEDADFIDEQAASICSSMVTSEGLLTCLDSGKLRGLPLALQRRVFRILIQRACGSLRDIESVHVDALVRLLFSNTGRSVYLPGGKIVTNERNRMVVTAPGSTACPWPVLDCDYTLNIPGETKLPGWLVSATIMSENFFKDDDIFSASFDLSRIGRNLSVRGRKVGDRFHPLGMTHGRKLQDFMVDSSIPRSWRDSVPIVCSPEQVVWIVGWRIDDRAKVTTSTQEVLRLDFHRAE
ncbi:MAG: tRNA lysidine(34) synthetase TilS [Dehalococcoidia bacterium]|nr:tRNA lysidine(34) synthetase TilS [Dehalococcoidia bacterium]